MKKILIYLVIIALVAVVIFVYITNNKNSEIIQNQLSPKAVSMCYQYSEETDSGFPDRAWLKMTILDDKVTGEYQNLPAQTDSKIGTFSGTVGEIDPNINGRIADVLWDSFGEGMNIKEQLNIQFSEEYAFALFGEMVDRGDGVYVYKDETRLSPSFQMSQIDCEILDDKIIVEKHIRDNVKTIVPEEPVLGGSWYVTTISINTATKTGTMTYEDGHIQDSKSFEYIRNNNEVKINLIEPVFCAMDAKLCPDGSYVGRTGPNCEFFCP